MHDSCCYDLGCVVAVTSQFQCQIFSGHSRILYYTPNIPNSYLNHENLGAFSTNMTLPLPGVTYIFDLPPLSQERNCSGTVLAVQYCYHANLRITGSLLGQALEIFEFLPMNRDDFQFTVASTITVQSTPSHNICSVVLNSGNIQFSCCDVASLTIRPTVISESRFTFGIQTSQNSNIRPLFFAKAHNVEFFIAVESHSSYFLSEASRLNGTLFLLRFIIGN